MTIAPLFSLAAAAGGTLAAVATGAAENVTSFVNSLHTPEPAEKSPAADLSLSPLTLDISEKTAREDLQQFQGQFQKRLAELGIDGSQPITLTVDGLGNIRETSGHPQAAEIEQLLASDDSLARQFREAASKFELLRAGREHSQFAELYAKNPDLAVSQYSHLFDDRRDAPKFSLQLLGDTAEPSFA